MKTALLIAGLLPGLWLPARAEWTLGRGALQLEAGLNAVYDSNLRASAQESDDFYLSAQPRLQYRRLSARFNTQASASMTFKRHLEETAADSDDAHAQVNWQMVRTAADTVGASFGLSYLETSDAVLEVNDRVRSKTLAAAIAGEVLLARRHLLNAGLTRRETKRDLASDQNTVSVRAGYSYVGFVEGTSLHFGYTRQQSESTDQQSDDARLDQTAETLAATFSRLLYAEVTGGVTAGYRWLDRSANEAAAGLPDRKGSFVGLTMTGPFLPRRHFPKTTGTFRLAYEQADVPGLNDTSNERLVGQLDLTWQARERTSVNFYLRRAQDLSVDDNTVVKLGGGLTVYQDIGHFIKADAGVAYTQAEFIGYAREDRRYEARVGAGYQLNRTWSTRVSYRYLNSVSTAAIADYERHIVMLTLTYAF